MRTLLILLLGTVVMLAQPVYPPVFWAASSSAGQTFLVHQDFEGTGYDNSETWTEAGTCTIDEDNVATVIDGSQSLNLNTTANACSTFTTFAANGTVFGAMKLRHVSGTGIQAQIVTFRSGTTARATFRINTGSFLTALTSGGTANASTSAMPTDNSTDIWLWFEYVTGSGANAIARAGWSTDGVKPTLAAAGLKTCVSSDGTGTDTIDHIYLGASGSATMQLIYDRVRVSATSIGSSFP